jgi:hypothetical protein
MRYLFYTLFTVFPFSSSYCQNLILNGAFEERNICTEFTAKCAPVGRKSLDLSGDNYSFTIGREGSRSSGIVLQKQDMPDYRTYLCTRLLCPLQKDSIYTISFYLKSDLKTFPTVSFAFTKAELHAPNTKRVALEPSINFTGKQLFSPYQKQKWVQCVYDYQAIGDENYLTIGNFFQDKSDLFQALDVKNITCDIDDVRIEPTSKIAPSCMEIAQIKAEIIADRDRHTTYDIIKRRLRLKEDYTNGKEYDPNTPQKKWMPCAGDEWTTDYIIDTLRVVYEEARQNNWQNFKQTIIQEYAPKRETFLGVTVVIYTDESDIDGVKQGYDIGYQICETLGFEKTALCIQKKPNRSVHAMQQARVEVLFLIKEN